MAGPIREGHVVPNLRLSLQQGVLAIAHKAQAAGRNSALRQNLQPGLPQGSPFLQRARRGTAEAAGLCCGGKAASDSA